MPSGVMSADSRTMRVVLPVDIRDKFRAKCEGRGQSMSERARQLVVDDVLDFQTPAEKSSSLMSQATEINEASGYPEPTMEEIDDFIAEVRKERLSNTL